MKASEERRCELAEKKWRKKKEGVGTRSGVEWKEEGKKKKKI
jgi:hypothetical protein